MEANRAFCCLCREVESGIVQLKSYDCASFGATASPVAFLEYLSGYLPDPKLPFEKTTLHVVCQFIEWYSAMRDMNDPEAGSIIDWIESSELIELMQKQGKEFKRVDTDESEMIVRALP